MRTLLEYGLANAVAATALALVALAVGLVVRRPAVRNALWVLVFVRLLLPPLWTIPLPVPLGHSEPEPTTVASAIPDPLPVSTETTPAPNNEPLPEFIWDAEALALLAAKESEPAKTEPAPARTVPVAAASEREFRLPRDTYSYLVVVWMAGSVFILCVRRDESCAPSSASRRPNNRSPFASKPNRWLWQWACVSVPKCCSCPAAFGLRSGCQGCFATAKLIRRPARAAARRTAGGRAGSRTLALASRRPVGALAGTIVCGIYWWHPLLGWFRQKLRQSEEECCDMGGRRGCGRKAYATALVETVGCRWTGACRLSRVGKRGGAGPKPKAEVTMIMRATWPRLTRLGLATMLGIGGLGLASGGDCPGTKDLRSKIPAQGSLG